MSAFKQSENVVFRPTVALEDFDKRALQELHNILQEKSLVSAEIEELHNDLECYRAEARESAIEALKNPLDAEAMDEAVKSAAFKKSIKNDLSELEKGRLFDLKVAEVAAIEKADQREMRRSQRIGRIHDGNLVLKQERAIETMFHAADVGKAVACCTFEANPLSLSVPGLLIKAQSAESAAQKAYAEWAKQEALKDAAAVLESSARMTASGGASVRPSGAASAYAGNSDTSPKSIIALWHGRIVLDQLVYWAYKAKSVELSLSKKVRHDFERQRAKAILKADQEAALCLVEALSEPVGAL